VAGVLRAQHGGAHRKGGHQREGAEAQHVSARRRAQGGGCAGAAGRHHQPLAAAPVGFPGQ
jgi:hypothetical protein